MNLQLLIFVFCAVFSVIPFLDFFVYCLQKAPKKSVFSFRFWIFGALCSIAAIYWYMNGGKFL